MHTMSIQLPEPLSEKVETESDRKGISKAELIRNKLFKEYDDQ